MHIKYSLNILMSRYGIIFRVIVYCAVALLFLVTIAYSIAAPLLSDMIDAIRGTGWTAQVHTFVSEFLSGDTNIADTFAAIGMSLNTILDIFVTNRAAVIKAVVVFVVFGVLAVYVLNLANLSYSDVINHFMNSNSRFGFTSNYIYNLKKSALYSLLYLVTKLPLTILCWTAVYFIVYGLIKGGAFIIALPLGYLFYIMAQTFINVLFMGWVPAIVVDGVKVHTAITEGRKVFAKHFKYAFINSFMATFLSHLFVSMCSVFTFGIGILIAVPTAMMFRKILELVLYYSAKNYKFYCGETIIIEGKLND